MPVTFLQPGRLAAEMSPEEYTRRLKPVQHKMYRFALHLLHDGATAKDVVQDVSVKLWQQRQKLPEIENLEAWCIRLTKNRCLDVLRSKGYGHNGLDHQPERADPALMPDDKLEQRDLRHKIDQLLRQLPQNQGMAMHLRDIEGLSYQEIADTLDISLAQVKINIHRARKFVRRELEKINAYGI